MLCSKCQQNLPEEQFHKSSRNPRGRQAYCKECNKLSVHKHMTSSDRNKQVRAARKLTLAEQAREYKRSRGCSLCDEDEPCCLELHHLDPSTKEYQPSNRVYVSHQAFLTEAEKCIVLCSNCHKKVHAGIKCIPGCSSA